MAERKSGMAGPEPQLIVVAGPPGAGKSTLAQLLPAHFEPCALVAGDDFLRFPASGHLARRTGAHGQDRTVVEAAAAAVGRLLEGGYSVVYDGVLGPWFLPRFLAVAGVDELHHLVLLPPEDTCADRVAMRTGPELSDPEVAREVHRQFAHADIPMPHLVPVDAGPRQSAEAALAMIGAGAARWPGA